MRSAVDGFHALREALAREGGTLATAAASAGMADGGDEPGPVQRAVAGPRARGHAAAYELLLEMIAEGVLLHYGRGRVGGGEDLDLALLLGDQLFALGLTRLAALGDLQAIRELADVISLISEAGAAGDDELVDAIWAAGCAAVGWGGDLLYEQAKADVRDGLPEALGELRDAALRLAGGWQGNPTESPAPRPRYPSSRRA